MNMGGRRKQISRNTLKKPDFNTITVMMRIGGGCDEGSENFMRTIKVKIYIPKIRFIIILYRIE
jgi:hypothetical protein